MKRIMFESVPNFGNLYMEELLFSFENIPIVFTCLGDDSSRFICLCDDVINDQTWLIAKIPDDLLLDLLYDKISICKAFELINNEIVIAISQKNKLNYTITSYQEIDPLDLPNEDEYLEMQDELCPFICKIENNNNNKVKMDSYDFYVPKFTMTTTKVDIKRIDFAFESASTKPFYFTKSTVPIESDYSKDNRDSLLIQAA